MTTIVSTSQRWRARPVLAAALRALLFAAPLLASSCAVYGLSRALPPDATRSWWGLAAMLALGLLVAVAVERAARRLLPIALLLKLSMVFPDRAPSRLQLARATATRGPRDELLWSGRTLEPTSTSDLVLALIGALGAHDRRTRGHSERVRLLCDMLAVELGLDDDDRDRLRWASLLHDVGKIEVSARILSKPAGLTEPEFDLVRLHPAAGAALATPLLPWLGSWGDGILDHHERYDGTGYPNGKAGHEISAAGRLIGVIDAFETMTAARPYKKAVPTRAAREELARCAGTHFDPVYVRAFLAISLPRLLWAMGPLSFLLQLPFLASAAQSGVRAGAMLPQAAGALAAGAAGVAVLATGGAAPGLSPAIIDAAAARPVQTAPSASALGGSTRAPEAQVASPTAAPRRQPSTRAIPVTSPRPAPATPTRTPAPSAAPRPAAAKHPAIASGPPSTTASRTATFQLTDVPGTQWECQLSAAAGGTPSRWEPCAGRVTFTVRRDGDQVLRVRDASTRDVVDTWRWTVTSSSAGTAATKAPKGNGPTP